MKVIPRVYNDKIETITDIDIKLHIVSFLQQNDKKELGLTNKEWLTVIEDYYRKMKKQLRYNTRMLYNSNTKFFLTCLDNRKLKKLNDYGECKDYIDKRIQVERYDLDTYIKPFIKLCKKNETQSYIRVEKVKEFNGNTFKVMYFYKTEVNSLLSYIEVLNDKITYYVEYYDDERRNAIRYINGSEENYVKKYYVGDTLRKLTEKEGPRKTTTEYLITPLTRIKTVDIFDTELATKQHRLYNDCVLVKEDFSRLEGNVIYNTIKIFRDDGTLKRVIDKKLTSVVSVMDLGDFRNLLSSDDDDDNVSIRSFILNSELETEDYTVSNYDNEGNLIIKYDMNNLTDVRKVLASLIV